MNSQKYIEYINNGGLDKKISRLYGSDKTQSMRNRITQAIDNFCLLYGDNRDIEIFSVPGRSELSGNHTDHNCGCVVASSINLDIIAIASKNDGTVIRLKSEGFGEDTVDFSKYTEPLSESFGTSASIIAGMCAAFSMKGYNVGAFDAYTTSNVLKGSGLSSSAAFEDMIGNIENHLYNNSTVSNIEIAKLAQYAENKFFGKPCGLMDQVACAVGGVVAIDFENPESPVIDALDIDISEAGYNLCIVNTGGNHADLTEDYASVPAEMKAIASYFGKSNLRQTDEAEVIASIPALREKFGDRAILRALHFFEENKRVSVQKEALKNNDLDTFFENVIASGRSSFCYLQNVYTTKNTIEQGLSLALCLAEKMLGTHRAAWRVHGGGFAGTIQAFVPADCVEKFRKVMDGCFGDGACLVLSIRTEGAIKL